MSENTAETPTEATTPEVEQQPETFTREYVEALRKENAKYRTKAAEVGEAAKAAEKARLAAMTEAERAVVEAEQRGRLAVLGDLGKRLARTEFDAAAARRNPGFDTAGALEYLDLSRLVGDDGEPDIKAISAAVERLVPAPATAVGGGTPRPDMSQGASTPLALNGDGLENALKQKLGIT